MIKPPQILLMDVDGVLVRPDQPFSELHARTRTIDLAQLQTFFQGAFREATLGRADLKDLIAGHRDVWGWSGDPAELLAAWFEAENQIDFGLLATLQRIRATGLPVYLATNQEKYRAAYLREVMFPDMFDGIFVSCELHAAKPDRHFFELIIDQLQRERPHLRPEDITFFDDTPSHVAGARLAGLTADIYTGAGQIEDLSR